MDIQRIQQAMQHEQIDCWMIYDFQGMNPILSQLLGTKITTTRRVFLIISATGETHLLGSRVDQDMLRNLPFEQHRYVSWQEMDEQLQALLAAYRVVALDYSPHGILPVVSRVDAGTFEKIKSFGKTIVSSANVFQAATAVWDASVLAAHIEDARRVAQIKDDAFQLIASFVREGKPITEYDVQCFIMRRFEESGLTADHPPIVAVNEHSGDPHYTPTKTCETFIKKGDWILIDLWAKRRQYDCVYADMTWVGFAGANPPAKHREIFGIVKGAVENVLEFLAEAAKLHLTIEGWEVDDIARNHIASAGYGHYFLHRTGHSLGPGDRAHGSGVNLDNLETHDMRTLIPGIGFSVEPGIYLPEFGVRLEINVYMNHDGPQVTTPFQNEIICLDV